MKVEHVEPLINRVDNNRALKAEKKESKSNGSSNSQQQKKTLLKNSEKSYSEKELEKEIKKSVKDINDLVEKANQNLSFKIHDKTKKLMVQVVDLKTQEVIKELPPEELLDLEAKIHEMVGLLIDEKV